MDFIYYQYNYLKINLLNCVEMCHNFITLESDQQAIFCFVLFVFSPFRPTEHKPKHELQQT